MKAKLVFLALLSLTGCAQYQWVHPYYLGGSTQADQAWKKDSYECERDMRQSSYFGGGITGALSAQSFSSGVSNREATAK